MSAIIVDHAQNSRRPGGISYPLDNDVLKGFKEAVHNNQVTLALEYLRYIVDFIVDYIPDDDDEDGVENPFEAMENRIAELEKTTQELEARLASFRKTTKQPRATAAKEEPDDAAAE